MSLHRVLVAVVATIFTAGISSAASARCCGWGAATPVAYAPVTYANAGCGHCGTPSAAVVYAQPVMPAPVPVVATTWGSCGCACGCRGLISYASPGVEPIAIAPAPIYVVNQGPDYTGPGIMTPFHTWTQPDSYVVPGSYPYFSGYGAWHRHYGYAHRPLYRYGYRARYRFGARYRYGARRAFYRGGVYGRPVRRVYR